MTIDERLEKLTERHEALAQTVEILVANQRERDERDRQRDERQEKRDERQDALMRTLTDRTIQAMEAINRLGNIVGAHDVRLDEHEERLDDLQGKHPDLP
ncbi:hypothetical protein SBA4_3870003 [Candidatus Sulfopaludibacter sp. SbA4]|nr:hypothetical protein SBA4_3870003 [Candidatus Sulfopaludibacter sp. SbA4]